MESKGLELIALYLEQLKVHQPEPPKLHLLKQEPFALVNARLGYEAESYGVYLFANNIFDTEYVTAAYIFGPVGSVGSYGASATVGVQVRAQF